MNNYVFDKKQDFENAVKELEEEILVSTGFITKNKKAKTKKSGSSSKKNSKSVSLSKSAFDSLFLLARGYPKTSILFSVR